jgi:signal transduction histidine kinase
VDNACKYGAGPIELGAEMGEKTAALAVRDHGPGVPATEAPRLFRPFHKSATDAARSAPGVGLGLALSRRLARRMRGDLRLDPSVPDGARFTLNLPRSVTPAPASESS